ncbi:MAG: SHOCT domain-containing protein [Ornithinibacter sp.]
MDQARGGRVRAMGAMGWMSPWFLALTLGSTLLLWVVAALAIIRLLGPPPPPQGQADGQAPLAALDESLARDEISLQEYRSRRRRVVDGH